MRLAKLTSRTKKGKQIIRQHGDKWEIIKISSIVNFDKAMGPWLFITPMGESDKSYNSRWINKNSDKNFNVEIIY